MLFLDFLLRFYHILYSFGVNFMPFNNALWPYQRKWFQTQSWNHVKKIDFKQLSDHKKRDS